jgi:hypothetical protein
MTLRGFFSWRAICHPVGHFVRSGADRDRDRGGVLRGRESCTAERGKCDDADPICRRLFFLGRVFVARAAAARQGLQCNS